MGAETNRQDNVAVLGRELKRTHPIQFTQPPLGLVVCHGYFHAKVCSQDNPGESSTAAVPDIAKHVSDTQPFPTTNKLSPYSNKEIGCIDGSGQNTTNLGSLCCVPVAKL